MLRWTLCDLLRNIANTSDNNNNNNNNNNDRVILSMRFTYNNINDNRRIAIIFIYGNL